MAATYMAVECFARDDEDETDLQHNAVVTAVEAATHLGEYRLRITGFVLDSDAAEMTLTERGLASLEQAA